MSLRHPAPLGRAARLAARRETLVALGRAQREVVALRWHGVEPSLRWVGWVERGWSAWHWVRRQRASVLMSVAALTPLTGIRPRWTARLLAGALAAARVARWLR